MTGVVVCVQKKQSLQKATGKYAAVHESRTAEDRRTAAELSARLAKLRSEHTDSAAQVASELNQPSVSNDDQIDAGVVERVLKEKEPWPAKVYSCCRCLEPCADGIACEVAIFGLPLLIASEQGCSVSKTVTRNKVKTYLHIGMAADYGVVHQYA